jgi:hypothetical protein
LYAASSLVADRRVDAAQAERYERAARAIARWRLDPVTFVRDELKAEPDPWQAEVLRAFPKHQRIALQACKGPGKSTVLSWLILNFLASRPFPKIACTSVTGENLRDGLWSELGKWLVRSEFLKQSFDYQKERISYRPSPENWFVSARRWRRDADAETQEATLAGLHADYILVVVDEAGGVPDAVVNAAEGALSTGVEAHLVLAGNPIVCEGPLYRAATLDRPFWRVFEITGDPDDPNRAPRVSIEWARNMLRKYGRSSPWVQVDVLGRFPSNKTEGLLTLDAVLGLFGRTADVYGAPLSRGTRTLGLDVARKGSNQTVLVYRDGDLVTRVEAWQGFDLTYTTGRVRDAIFEHDPDLVVVDDTGVGGGVTDVLLAEGFRVYPLNGCETAVRDDLHGNLKSEIALSIQDRVREGRLGIVEEAREETQLVTELTTMRLRFDSRGRRKLEDKDAYKKRTGRSPDYSDALFHAFATDVIGAGAIASSDEAPVERRGALAGSVRVDRSVARGLRHAEEAAGEWLLPRRAMRLRQ